MNAECLIFRKLTSNEFKAITNTINSKNGGSQTYIDFPKGCISDEELKDFFMNDGVSTAHGFEWTFLVNSLAVGRTQQKEVISARRDSSNSLREQNNENRVEIWKSNRSGFPQENYDEKNNPIIIFILRSDDKEYWAGWFYRNSSTDEWTMNRGLSSMFWKDCGYIKFDVSIPFDVHDFTWPFLKTSKNKINMIMLKNISLQQIFYGAPGTGKSHAVKAVSDQYPDTIRTTFHPDSDYASFVGAYKPTVAMEKLYDEAGMPVKVGGQELAKNQITYKFVKQAFLKAYVKAWKKFQKAEDASHVDSQFLVIEEINRGNCAQIFGDLFQLLDRKNGFSEYPIEADEDIAKSLLDEDSPENPSFGKNGLQLAGWQKTYIENLFQKSKDKDVIVEKISMGKVLVLPCNLYIWATMNTSDQSLFPIDSAFKRRWDWKYVPINTEVKKWAIEVEGQKYSWTSFLDKMNEQIFSVTHSEDKKFGFFFCHADKKSDDTVEEEDVISAEKFVSKVIFFIYNDVFKDYGFDRKIFAGEDGKPIQFHEYYRMDGSVDESKVKKFLENVEVKPFEAEQAEEAQE